MWLMVWKGYTIAWSRHEMNQNLAKVCFYAVCGAETPHRKKEKDAWVYWSTMMC